MKIKNPKIWGPGTWKALHTFTSNYTPDQANYYKEVFTKLQNVLPCEICRESYSKIIKIIPIDNYTQSNRNMMLWLYLVHKMVNEKLNKPEGYTPSFEDVYKRYSN
jgi:5-methylcytosine-specific restriction endonuclease McrA